MSKATKKRDDLLNDIYDDENSIFEDVEDVEDYMDYVYRVIDDFEKGNEDKYLSRLEKYQLAQSENDRNHNSVSMERKLINIVKTGDLNALKEMYSDKEWYVDFSTIGYVSKNLMKRHEYYALTTIVITTRAAVEAGVSVEKAYELSDIFMQQISESTTILEYSKVGLIAIVTFVKLVSDLKKNKKYPYIDACKDFIARNLRKPIRVSDIGPQIGINNSYLSKKFAEAEGMTISQYICKERCEHAANLLKYSNYELSEIAEYFCFSSHSHFGAKFKKIYGMTPNEYRKRYKESGTYFY